MPNSSNLPVDKKLFVKRTIKKIREKILRTTQSAGTNENSRCNDFWDYIRDSTTDEYSHLCLDELMNLRHTVKEDLKNLILGEKSMDEGNSLLSLLRNCDLQSVINSAIHGQSNTTNNSPSHIPTLDISSVRKGDSATEQQYNEDSTLYKEKSSLYLYQSTESVECGYSAKNSPREVTDSSVESDQIEEANALSVMDHSTIWYNERNKNAHSYLRNEQQNKEMHEDIITEDKSQTGTAKWKKLGFIPSIPVTAQNPTFVQSKEAEVQTIESHLDQKEVRDVATDLPFFDIKLLKGTYLAERTKEELGVDESDYSPSVISSDQSAGQVPAKLLRSHPVVAVLADGSIHKRSPRVSEVTDESMISSDSQERIYRYQRAKISDHRCNSFITSESGSNKSENILRTPRVTEITWRPSSRRLQLEEVDISSSQDAAETLYVREEMSDLSPNSLSLLKPMLSSPSFSNKSPLTTKGKCESFSDESNASLTCNTTMSGSSHHDEEHTYNQISQIISD